MFAKLKAKARAAFDNVVGKTLDGLPDPQPVAGIPAEEVTLLAHRRAAQVLALAAILKRPAHRGPTPRRERRAEKWARQDRSCSYGQGLVNHFSKA
jgi:hypothetical protein